MMAVEVDQVKLKRTHPFIKKRSDAPRRRKTKIDKKVKSWIEQNIKIKTKISDDGQFSEVPTDCYGEIDFIGIGRKAKAKFVRFSDSTAPALIYDLIIKQWRVGKPRLVITVSGSGKNFDLDPELKQIFEDGLLKVARTPGAWIITNGIHEGVTKYAGEALDGAARACIGISPFGAILNRHHLQSADHKGELGGKFPYRISCSLLRKGSFLDHNLTHHLLVDDGTDNKHGGIQFQSEFEKYIMECAVAKIPLVLLVLQGCVDTIEKVWARVRDEAPISIVVVKGSGKAADLIAYSLSITEGVEKDVEINTTKILAKTRNLFPELSEEKQETICDRILFCMQKREFFTVYNVEENRGIDEAIFMSLLNGQNISPMDQLQFALLWDRADLGKENILNQSRAWKLKDLEFATIMALAMDRVDFVKLLIEYGIGIELLLTNDVLEFLYGYQSLSSTSTLNFEIDADKYIPAKIKKYPNVVDILCSIKGINRWKCAISRKTIHTVITRLCKNLIGKRKQEFIEKLNSENEDDVHFIYPYRELFFWAVLNNKQKMAIYLWQFEEEAISKALIAAEINNVLYAHAQTRVLQDDVVKSFSNNSKQFRGVALGLLDECYRLNESKTVQLIACEFHQFADQTCLGLAVDTEDLDFVSHNAVQLLLNEVWTGSIKTRQVTDIQILFAFVFPPLINHIPFYSETAFNQLSFVLTDESHHQENTDDVSTPYNETEVLKEEGEEKIKPIVSDLGYLPARPRSSKKQSSIPYYKKVYEFYFKTPVIKFYANVFWYLVFLGVFAYVTMVKEEEELLAHEYLIFLYVFSLTVAEINEVLMTDGHTLTIKLKLWLHDRWDNLDVMCIIFYYITFSLRVNEHKLQVGNVMYAINGGLWVIRLLQVFFVNRTLGPYVVMLFRMTKDLLNFMVILFVFLISYGVTSKAILNPAPKEAPLIGLVKDAIFHPYFNIYGELFTDTPVDNTTTSFGTPVISSYAEPIAWFLLGIYLLIANVLLMNILIAAFNNTFNDVQENASQIWKFQRHGLVQEYAQRVQLPPPFSLIVHACLLGKWILQKCRIWKRKYGGNSILKAMVSVETKEELLEFENKCMTVFIRKRGAESTMPVERTTVDILNYVDGISTDLQGIKVRLKDIETNVHKLTLKSCDT